MLKIKKNVPISKEEKSRHIWPFADMKVGDVLEVKDIKEWKSASKYAHAWASKKDWKMKTVWMKTEKKPIGRIRRIA